jgi:glyoxylase-like metal-dependent hydrolase (beta-lactamase superfamily II)
VIVKTGGRDYFLAGDATYTEGQLLERRADGISPNPKVAIATIDRICDYLASTPTVYLPAHDPATAIRLRDAQVTRPLPHHARDGVRSSGQHETLFQE